MKAETVFIAFLGLFLQCCFTRAMKTYCDTAGNNDDQFDVGVNFKSKPTTPVVTCTLVPVSMYCCMSNFSRILWFRFENNVWINLEESYAYNRHFYERNQTVRLGRPSHDDSGQYKCVGYGRSASDEINYEIEFVVRDCENPDNPPQPLYPRQYSTERVTTPGSDLQLVCIGLVGPRQISCNGEQCAIGWTRTVGGRTVPVSNSSNERVHFVNKWIIDDNALQSTIHINKTLSSDFDGEYACWMHNTHGALNPARIVVIRRRHVEYVETSSDVFKPLTATFSCILLVACFVSVVVWRYRLHIKLYIKEMRRTPPNDDDLLYDVVLMRSDDSERFATYLYQGLTADKPYSPLAVFHYDEDIPFGHVKAESLSYAISRSRCVLAVISPGFVGDRYCRFCFESAVRDGEVDVVFVLCNGVTSPDDRTVHAALSDEAGIALLRSRRCFIWPLNDVDFDYSETMDCKAVDQFWIRLRLAIPSRREPRAADRERKPLLA